MYQQVLLKWQLPEKLLEPVLLLPGEVRLPGRQGRGKDRSAHVDRIRLYHSLPLQHLVGLLDLLLLGFKIQM